MFQLITEDAWNYSLSSLQVKLLKIFYTPFCALTFPLPPPMDIISGYDLGQWVSLGLRSKDLTILENARSSLSADKLLQVI